MSTAVQDVDAIKDGLKGVLGWPYQTPRVVALLYSEKHTNIFPEDFLGKLYFRMKSEGTLGLIFPGQNMGHLNQFLRYMSTVRGLLICCEKTEDKPHPIGLGWICEIDGVDGARKAAFGFGFFKEAWGRTVHVELSSLMLAYWFREMNIDILFGTTLNQVARNYSKRFGFKYLCQLPKFFCCNGVLENAHLICLEKEVFLPMYQAWKDARG